LRKQDKTVIWPTYFDSTKTRDEGRRISKSLAVASPEILEVKKAVERVNLDHELVLDVSYPKTPWLKTGLILMAKKEPKNQTVKRIAEQLLKIRSAATTK
jgi:signal recognition particle subunit SRP19